MEAKKQLNNPKKNEKGRRKQHSIDRTSGKQQ